MADKRMRRIARWLIAPLLLVAVLIPTIALGSDGVEGPFMNAIAMKIALITGIDIRDYLGNNTCGFCRGDPVNLAEGELLYSRTDIAIPGMLSPLDMTFRYRSRRNYNSHWGFGWYFPYEMRLFAMAGGDVMWRIGTGEEKTFIKSGSSYTPPADHHVTLTQQMDGSWILKEKGGTQYLFSVEGVLTEIIDRNSNTLQFVYETDAFGAKTKEPISGSSGNIVALDYRLIQIVGTLGKSFYFTYYGSSDGPKNGRLKTLSDDFSRTVGYDYDTDGNLVSVTSPVTSFQDGSGTTVTRGRVTSFTYSSGFRSSQPGSPEHALDHNLLIVTDDRGLVQLTSQYDSSDRVQGQSYNGGNTTFAYTTTTDGRITSVDETDNNGFVHRHAFDANGNPTTDSTQSSGIHPTLSATAFYGTTYTYDSAQQVTEVKEQLGNGVELTYDSQGNILERRAKTNVTAANSGSDIVSSYTYESTFNRVKTATDPLGNVTTFYYDYEEATLGDENGDGITTQAAGNLVRVDRPNATLPDGTTQSGITFKFWYNTFGQLIRTVDAEANVVERQYYPSTHASYGMLSKQIVDPSGLALTTEYTYDTYGFPATVKNPRANVTTYTANAIGEVLEVDAPLNAAMRATYDANGNVVKAEVHNVDETGTARTPEWIKSVQVYDAWDQLTSTVEDVSGTTSILTRTTSYEYDGLANLKKVTSPEGRVVTYEYDENGLNWRQTLGVGTSDATSSVIHVDNNWRVTQSLDGRRGQTTIAYDLFDRVISIADPAGNVSQADWNKRGQATERRQYTGSSTLATKVDFTYDELGRMTKQKQLEVGGSGYSEGWFEFNKNSLLHRVRSPRGYFTSVTYDAADRRTSVTDPVGNSVTYTLDADGNPTTVTEDEVESTETFDSHATWDALDRLLTSSSVDRLSSTHEPTTTYAYDSRSLLIQVTDAIGRTSRSTYDLAARLLSTNADSSGLAIVTQYGYDKDDLVTSLVDASSNTTSWDYDAVGRQVKATYPTGAFEAWTYDANHNVLTSRTQDGVQTAFIYQANNLLKSRAAPNILQEFTWNGFAAPLTAKVTQFATVTSSISYSYDGFGRRSSETQDGYSVGYAYDADHNVTQVTYPDSYAVTNGHDSLDRLSTVSDTGGTIASYAYDGPGRIHSRTTGVTETNGWDGLRRLIGIDAGSYFHPTYGFDDVNRRTYRKNNHAGGRGDVYGYDGVSRLSDIWYDATSPDVGTTGYTSDFHITQSAADDRTSTTLSGVTTTYNTADSLHRYTQVGSAARSYDAKGNLTDDASLLFEYDPWNRLTQVKDKGTNATRSQFAIDALGRRSNKTEPGLTTKYVYAGSRLVAEYEDSGSGAILKRRYVYGSGLDEAVALDSAGQRYWCYQDALGSTEVTCDASNTLVERYTYDAFGRPSVVDGGGTPIINAYGRPASSLKNSVWYAGSRWDGESGQYHMRARQYEPQSGRFVSRDPLGYPDGPNPYRYGMSSPENWTDPFGLEANQRKAAILRDALIARTGQDVGSIPYGWTWRHYANQLETLYTAKGIANLDEVTQRNASGAKMVTTAAFIVRAPVYPVSLAVDGFTGYKTWRQVGEGEAVMGAVALVGWWCPPAGAAIGGTLIGIGTQSDDEETRITSWAGLGFLAAGAGAARLGGPSPIPSYGPMTDIGPPSESPTSTVLLEVDSGRSCLLTGDVEPAILRASNALEEYLGPEFTIKKPTEGSDLIFTSKDGTKQVRFDLSDPHGLDPHINIEKFVPRDWYPGDTRMNQTINLHVFPKK